MTNNPVGWFEIYVQDMARAKRFYESVLQVKLEKLDSPEVEMWSFPMTMDRYGARVLWSKWKVLLLAGIARWFILVARIVRLKLGV